MVPVRDLLRDAAVLIGDVAVWAVRRVRHGVETSVDGRRYDAQALDSRAGKVCKLQRGLQEERAEANYLVHLLVNSPLSDYDLLAN